MDYVRARGLVAATAATDPASCGAEVLGGGISNVVLAVDVGGYRVVVKQSLSRLRVPDEWLATRERVLTEAAALRLAGRLTPGAVPEVLDVDEEAFVITIAAAPGGTRTWKDALLTGQADIGVAEQLGSVLACWHGGTTDTASLADRFADPEAFRQLRVDPYHRTVMRRRPELADAIGAHVDALLATRRCLVHGDYSPKNVLVGHGWLWIIDFEVAHVGDPAFDVAFMLTHLMLKSIHRPDRRDAYQACAEAFWKAYAHSVPDDLRPAAHHLVGQLACLLLARVDGKSPADYLNDEGRAVTRAVGEDLLLDPPREPIEAWQVLAHRTTA